LATGMGLGTGMGIGRRTGTGIMTGTGMGLGIGTTPGMEMGTRKDLGTTLGTSTGDWHGDKHRHGEHHDPQHIMVGKQRRLWGHPPAPGPIRMSLLTAPSQRSWARSSRHGRRSARRGARRPSGSAWSQPPSSCGSSALPSCPPASSASSKSTRVRPPPVPSPLWPRSSRTWPTSPRMSWQGTAPVPVGRDIPMGKPRGGGDIPYRLCGMCHGQAQGSRVAPNTSWSMSYMP